MPRFLRDMVRCTRAVASHMQMSSLACRTKDAEKDTLRALKLYAQLVGEINPRYAAALEQHAAILDALGRPTEATTARERAKAVREQHAKENGG